jgi:hypothetical protein
MKDLNLHEEIIKSLKLISYDRSLTLSEQGNPLPGQLPSDLPKIKNNNLPDYKKNTLLDPKYFQNLEKENEIQNYLQTAFCKSYEKNFCKSYGGNKVYYKGDLSTMDISDVECLCKNGNQKIKDPLGLKDWKGNIMTYKVNDFLKKQKQIKKDYYIKKSEEKKKLDQIKKNLKNKGIDFAQTPSDRLGKTGEFKPYIDTLDNSKKREESKKREVLKYKSQMSKWADRLCGVANKVCPKEGGIEAQVYQDESGRWRCGCKKDQQIIVNRAYYNSNELSSKPVYTTINRYYQIGDYGKAYYEGEWSVKEFLSDDHNLLLAASLLSTFLLPGFGGVIVGGLFDAVDVGLSIYEKDPIAAGLGVIFMSLPVAKLYTLLGRSITKKSAKRIVNKIANGKKLSNTEKLVVENMGKAATLNLVLKVVFEKLMIKLFAKSSYGGKTGLFFMATIVKKLFKAGYLTTSFLFKTVLIMGGVGISWYGILKLFNMLPKELGIKEVTKNFSNVNLLITTSLKSLAENDDRLDIKLKNMFNPSVLLLQYALIAGKYNVTDKVDYSKTPNWKKKTDDGKINFNYDPKFDYLYKPENKTELDLKLRDWNKFKKQTLLSSGNKSTILPSKGFGYFDENTKQMVELFQKRNGLRIDGVAGKEVLNKICLDVENKKYGEIRNYANKNLKSLFDKEIDLSNNVKSTEKEKEKVADAYDDQKEKIQTDILNDAKQTFDTIQNPQYYIDFFKNYEWYKNE